MNKVVRDDRVAVLYSPGHGAGWFSWNSGQPECLFDPDVVALVEDGKNDEAVALANEKWPDGYWSGPLRIEWLDVGTHFRIHEYDGSESVETREALDWQVA